MLLKSTAKYVPSIVFVSEASKIAENTRVYVYRCVGEGAECGEARGNCMRVGIYGAHTNIHRLKAFAPLLRMLFKYKNTILFRFALLFVYCGRKRFCFL